MGSGTEALSLAMQALNVKPGDIVVLPANAYPNVFSITAIGAVPLPVDIDPRTFNMDPEELKKVIERKSEKAKKIKAAIVVHMYGRPSDILAIKKITDHYKIPLIEDCAHAHGAGVGTFADVSCFSFYPTKNLGALGDGGMVLTNDPEIAEKVKLLRMYGEKNRYNSVILGRNSRLDEVQAGFLSVKLKYLDRWNEERRKIANIYSKNLSTIPSVILRTLSLSKGTKDPVGIKPKQDSSPDQNRDQNDKDSNHVYHLYVISTSKRNQLKSYLESHGIGTGIHYPTPVHLIPSLKFLRYKRGDFPQSEKASEEVLSLPLWPGIKKEEVMEVCTVIKDFYSSFNKNVIPAKAGIHRTN